MRIRPRRRSLLGLAAAGIAAFASADVHARSRDFAAVEAPPSAPPPPLPRSGPLQLLFGIGGSYLHAGWSELATSRDRRRDHLAVDMRAAIGAVVSERAALRLELNGVLPIPPWFPLGGFIVGGVGAGATFFPSGGRWHLDITGWRSWAVMGRTNVDVEAGTTGTFDRIWLVEVGAGPVERRGRIDRGWTLSAFGGRLRADTASGFLAGLSLGYSWARW